MDIGGQGRSAAGLPQAGALDARFLVAGRCALYLLLAGAVKIFGVRRITGFFYFDLTP